MIQKRLPSTTCHSEPIDIMRIYLFLMKLLTEKVDVHFSKFIDIPKL